MKLKLITLAIALFFAVGISTTMAADKKEKATTEQATSNDTNKEAKKGECQKSEAKTDGTCTKAADKSCCKKEEGSCSKK